MAENCFNPDNFFPLENFLRILILSSEEGISVAHENEERKFSYDAYKKYYEDFIACARQKSNHSG